jgi:hypothetical protein
MKSRALARLKGYFTNLEAPTPQFVMAAYHRLWQITVIGAVAEFAPAG